MGHRRYRYRIQADPSDYAVKYGLMQVFLGKDSPNFQATNIFTVNAMTRDEKGIA
jgi:hypothetical protein